ncbi:MAG: hemolysin family protein [Deltaproteobacteria bacterium]|nr:hemolysin family protein [Deltaproteobacteria bacterium]
MDTGDSLALATGALALILRGLLVAVDTALLSTGMEEIQELAEAGKRGAARVLHLKANPQQTRVALRAGEMILLALTAVLAGHVGLRLTGEWLAGLGVQAGTSLLVGSLLSALAVTLIALVIGDLGPRAWAVRDRSAVARSLGWLAATTRLLFLPGVKVYFLLSDRIFRPMGLDLRRFNPATPLEDLEAALVERAQEGGVAAPTPELIHSIFEFGETTAKEVMIPRTQVVAVELGAPPSEVLETFTSGAHTRLPVYEGELDKIVGIIHGKDIIPIFERSAPLELEKIMRPPTFVPWSKRINEVMREFQQKHIHLAIVVDEFGGTMGLITLEDILEEIVGEIEDEFDPPETKDVEALPDGTFLVRASMEIEDFNSHFGTEIPEEGEFETLAGLLNLLAGAIPQVGDTFVHAGLKLTVAKRSERRIRQVRVQRAQAPN